MIYYLVDLLINNLNLYTSSLILINLDNYEKSDMFYILLIDIFINKIPIIFITLLLIKLLNRIFRKLLAKSFLVDNIIYIVDYLVFMIIIFFYRIDNFVFLDLVFFLKNSVLINYFFFLIKKLVEDKSKLKYNIFTNLRGII